MNNVIPEITSAKVFGERDRAMLSRPTKLQMYRYEYRYATERKDGRASSKIPSLAIETRVKMFIRFNGS